MSRFMEKPRQEHLNVVKHILSYISGTVDYDIVYPKRCNTDNKLMGYTLTGYTNNDLGGDIDERRSTSGIILFLGDMLVSGQSQKQKIVAFSTCEAEYMTDMVGAC